MLQYCCLLKFPKSCLQLSAGIDNSVILKCLIFHFLNGFSSLCHSVIFALLIISGMKNTMPVPLSFAEWGWTCIVTFGVGFTSWSGTCKCFVLCKWFQRQSRLIFLQRTETIFFFIHKGHLVPLKCIYCTTQLLFVHMLALYLHKSTTHAWKIFILCNFWICSLCILPHFDASKSFCTMDLP